MRKEYTKPLILFMVLSIMLSGAYFFLSQKAVETNAERYRYIAANQANIIKYSVDTAIARVFTFSALVRENKGDTLFFDSEGEVIYQEIAKESSIPLKNVAIAPKGVVTKVYPLEGNSTLVGFDFMDTSKDGNEEAVEAYKRGEVIVTNPFKLIQGGIGMAGRLPVFVTKDGVKSFWGLVTVTMDYDKMKKGFHLDNLEERGVDYQIWYEKKGERVVLSESKQKPQTPVTYDFTIQNLEWHIDVAPTEGWRNHWQQAFVFMTIIVLSLAMALLMLGSSRIRQANIKLQQLAHLDGLTNCYSRQYLNTVLIDQASGRWNDPGVKYSLAIVDIDNFKDINDTFGHEVGDRALIAVAHILQTKVKAANGDCVIRYGGDEFIILWNDVSPERFISKLTHIVEAVENIKFPDAPKLSLSISVGGEAYAATEEQNYYKLMKKADKKLYEAKEAGKNQFVC